MRANGKTILVFLLFIVTIWVVNSCTKSKKLSPTDAQLFDLARTTSGFVWFKNSPTLLPKSSGSGHPQALLRTRYNSVAASLLDSNGALLPGATFPEGSLIVKELFENATTLGRYAILYKNSKGADADAKGWVWGYINADGSVAAPANKKGSACISCHSQAGNSDYMLMGVYFP